MPSLARFRGWHELVEAAAEERDPELRFLVQVVAHHGRGAYDYQFRNAGWWPGYRSRNTTSSARSCPSGFMLPPTST